MLDIDEETLKALIGSRTGDKMVFRVWYNGELALRDELIVSDWSLVHDGDERQNVQGTLNLTVKDPDGKLSPWAYSDPLAVGGSRIQAFYQVGGAEEVPQGWYRISKNSSEESWQFRVVKENGYRDPGSSIPDNYRLTPISTGASIPLTANDLTIEVDRDRFLAPEQPQGESPTVRSEIERLVGDTLPIVYTNFTDSPVPKTVVWDDNRMEAVINLLDLAGASFRMTGAGELEVYTKSPESVAVLQGGDEGILIGFTKSMDLSDLHNIGSVESTIKEQQIVDGRLTDVEIPVYGHYEITEGDLRVGGPFGRSVVKAQNPLMFSQYRADQAAQTMVRRRLGAQRIDIEVTCLPHPALQIGDTVTVVSPVVDGRLVPLLGEISKKRLSGGASVNEMNLTVSCLLSDVEAAFKMTSIDDNLTGESPALTWDSVNPLRTWDDMNISWDELRG